MKLFAIALLALSLGACSSLGTLNPNAKSTDVADATTVAASNTAMTVAKVVARVQSLDCSTPADAPICDNAVSGDTNGQVQAKTQTCLITIATNAAMTAIQRQACSRLGLATPAPARAPLVAPAAAPMVTPPK